jgi:hypothetical protein
MRASAGVFAFGSMLALACFAALEGDEARAQYFNGPPTPAQGEVDLSGGWLQKFHQDASERREGAELGDYTALPINDAARLRADTWDAAKWTVPEHQCEPHPADYAFHGPANLQISKVLDPLTLKTVALRVIIGWMTPVRTIWLDGRPHPSANAPHTWQGFSTGRWEGDTLVVTTTHLKEGWIRRNGIARSEKARLTEHWMRRDNVLTIASFLNDPVYLTEPLVRVWNWAIDPGAVVLRYTCEAKVETDRPQGFVAHWPIGKNPNLTQYAQTLHVPAIVTRGGAAQMYPEYQDTLKALIAGGDK